jgi:DNA-binding CsgD family transcriptional regulator
VYLGTARRLQAAYADAIPLLEEGLLRCRAVGDDYGAALALVGLSSSAAIRGDPARAQLLVEEALELYRSVGDVRFVAMTQTQLGAMLAMAGQLDEAAGLLAEALAGHRAAGERVFVPYNLMWQGVVAALTDRPVSAARWLAAAEAHREALGGVMTPSSSRPIAQAMDRIRSRLGEAEFEEAWATGRRLSLDEIVADVTRDHAQAVRESAPQAPAPERLTARERDVARLVASGHSDRQVAEVLGIAVSTASVHVHRVLAKLGVRSRWQVAEVLRTAQ